MTQNWEYRDKYPHMTFPGFSEPLLYSDYVVEEKRQSRYAANDSYRVEVGVKCPRCLKENKGELGHGMLGVCKCGLHMVVFGNRLTIWM